MGAASRYLLDAWVPERLGFPWTTLAINIVGSFLLALLPAVAFVRRSPQWSTALGPGLLGGFTTLSAYAEESRALLADDQAVAAACYVVATLVACVAAVLVAEILVGRRERQREIDANLGGP